MFLKRLDTVGFKSFADRISVDFVQGVTAVVGPNGSGKSNITDAIRWVLGEQSAKSLRGSKMEDVIFAGSDSRKPLNFAEVALTLDNSDHALPIDYQEVSITRRVYRSGESEFYINQQACRLKDIVELFMDSGLGKEAFSIISQGKVEEILSSKAEERRSIFEEAAGVLKYKQRKKKAELKLDETQENLNRVEDIIHEIEGHIGPLEKQAQVAKEYLEKKDQLKHHEVSLLVTEIEVLKSQWDALLAEIEQKKENAIHKQTEIQQDEAKHAKEKHDLQHLDQQIEQLQNSLLTLTKELEHLEGQKRLFHERLKHYEENKDKLTQEQVKTNHKLTEVKEKLATEERTLASFVEKRNETKKQIASMEEKMSLLQENVEDKIEELKSDYIESLNEQAAKRNEIQSIERQLEQMKAKQTRLAERFQGLLSQRDNIEVEREEMETQYKEVVEIQAEEERVFVEMKQQYEAEKQELQNNEQKLNQGYQLLEKLRSKKEMLEEMKEDFSGFFHGVKAVLKASKRNQLKGIHGAVAELIDIPNQYLTTIETALGAQAQHIVVADESRARQAIQWLKTSNNGRATFLPLSTIQSKELPSSIREHVQKSRGYVGVGADLIQYDPQYEPIIKSLLGNILIAKSLSEANEIAASTGRRYRVVTLDGDVVNPGGSMSGGARKKTNNSLFTREKELTQIIEKLTDYEQKTKEFEEEIASQREKIKRSEQQLIGKEQQLDELKAKAHRVDGQKREIEMKLANVNEHLTIYDQEQSQFVEDEEKLVSSKKEVAERLQEIEIQSKRIQDQVNQLTEEKSNQQSNKEKLQEQFNELKVILAGQDGEVNNQREKVNQLRQQKEELREQIVTIDQQMRELDRIKEDSSSAEDIAAKTDEMSQDKTSTELKLQQKREERQQRMKLSEDMEREIKEKSRLYQQFTKEIQDKEVKANRLDVELENRLHQLQEEYVLTYEKARQTYGKTEHIEQAKQTVKQIKREIESLGTVNLGAIEEYERIKERYQFLTDQQNDLIEAKETLYTVIREMDEEMVRRFDHTFSQIQEEFSIVFKELFGGGRASLTLTDKTNLLETGVDIVAQPPGKKLQHLGLLSGGERALTAIALLFAILRVRPVPFCVLDEVEAALDEANVNRFAKYLKVFSEETQFIVITHRKGTMEEADVLYGVTMQESGVSKMVSVRLEETEEVIQA
ncbi:chromosome segregation protein SMC [Salirhabdus salicampi]|uniref:chromosome segregation protein SMC n=1 Tax=Salirhabdus salicampi TaxID=476102 RepID=UPI0020C314A4|nr:chromosome segregation protein SMC [Salirhabdus salicampi]MCP8616551.1 chromosome segregation protein SMC [Salirhabdus salicampi]